MIPLRIDVIRYDIRQAETDILEEHAACERTQAGGIERADQVKLFFVARIAELRLAHAFVENAPDVNARMIVVIFNHLTNAVFALLFKQGMPHLLFFQRTGMAFFPDEHSGLIAHIQKNLIVGIVRCTHGVCAEVFHERQIVRHGRRRKRTPVMRMVLVTAESLDPHGTAVEQNLFSLH